MNRAAVLQAAGLFARRVVRVTEIGGGCISATAVWSLDDGNEIFVKSESHARLAMLQAEAEGLEALADTQAVRIPRVLTVDGDARRDAAFLVTERIRTASPDRDFFARFGHQLARLHRSPRPAGSSPTGEQNAQNAFGWARDNFLGSSLQPNPREDCWIRFFSHHRLAHQLRLAQQNRCGSTKLYHHLDRILADIQSLLAGSDEPPALIHGDLWSGNYLCDDDQQPVLIDPAAYYGHREAEFGMLQLFGACPVAFYQAYHETYPLAEGWQQRAKVYVLYHLLNHLNLFGGSYLGQCESLAETIA